MYLITKWEEILSQFASAELAHTLQWRKIIETVYGYPTFYEIIQTSSGNLPIIAYMVQSLLSGKKITNMPFMFQAVPLVLQEEQELIYYNYFLQLAKKQKCYAEIKTRHKLQPTITNQLNLNEEIVSIYSYLELANHYPEQLAKYPKNLLKNLKRSQNKLFREQDIIIRTDCSKEVLYAFHTCMMQMYRNKDHMPCQPYQLFDKLSETFSSSDNIKLFSAWHNNRLVSGIFVLRYQETAEYGWGSTLSGYEHFNLPTILLDQAIEWSIGLGVKRFSFGCTSPTDQGLLDFKARWGSIQIPVYRYTYGKAAKVLDLNDKNSISRKMFSYLPLWIIRLLLPRLVPQLA